MIVGINSIIGYGTCSKLEEGGRSMQKLFRSDAVGRSSFQLV